ncbi:serine hydrolase domain-containing protein [Parasphingorhabdus sp.]|uniref:serine hydrolase domain-containing protein n=1 Tax=Parasphingorhabdus sp. TaxID=2709688 RepID=UPI003D26CBF7
MKQIYQPIVAALLLLTVSACTNAKIEQPVAINAGLVENFDQIVNKAVAQGFGGRVVIASGDQVIYDRSAGYSDANEQFPVTEATLFHVASITKYLTAIIILKAAEEGRIGLDQSISSLLPDSSLAKGKITIRQLLNHHSGLGSSYAAEAAFTAEAAISAIGQQPVDAEKIGTFRYSNDGYDLLAIILEQVYAKPYELILKEKITGPAGIAKMIGWSEVDKSNPVKVGQPLSELKASLAKRNYGMLGSAGLLTTARDLIDLQKAVGREKILNQESLAALHKPRDRISIGRTTFGGFLVQSDNMGPVFNVRGYEDWGDNAIMNHYLEYDLYVAIVTSKGPAEGSGEPFRTSISNEIELLLPKLKFN